MRGMAHDKSNSRYLVYALTAIVAVAIGAWSATYMFRPQEPPTLQNGTVLPQPRALPEFSLLDHRGLPFDNARLIGHWTLLFFGFANCADVCPTTLATITTAIDNLKDAATIPVPVFVSVDTGRDTSDILAKYVAAFSQDMIGVTGKQTDVDALTKALGVPSAIRPLDGGGYAVEHSAAILVINPSGQLQAIFHAPHSAPVLAADLRRLVDAY